MTLQQSPSFGERNTNVSTGGEYQVSYSNDGRRFGTITQRVTPANNALSAEVAVRLPPQSRVIAAFVYNHSSVGVDGTDATNTANSYGLFNVGTATGLATNTASNATSSTLVSNTSTASDGVAMQVHAATAAPGANTSTETNRLVIFPMFTNSNRIYPKSDGFLFNGTSNIDVTVYVEEFQERYTKGLG